jgi:hypothetical protein
LSASEADHRLLGNGHIESDCGSDQLDEHIADHVVDLLGSPPPAPSVPLAVATP